MTKIDSTKLDACVAKADAQARRWYNRNHDDAREYDVEDIKRRFQCTQTEAQQIYTEIKNVK